MECIILFLTNTLYSLCFKLWNKVFVYINNISFVIEARTKSNKVVYNISSDYVH